MAATGVLALCLALLLVCAPAAAARRACPTAAAKKQRLRAAWRAWESLDAPNWHAGIDAMGLDLRASFTEAAWDRHLGRIDRLAVAKRSLKALPPSHAALPAALPCQLRFAALLGAAMQLLSEELDWGSMPRWALQPGALCAPAPRRCLTRSLKRRWRCWGGGLTLPRYDCGVGPLSRVTRRIHAGQRRQAPQPAGPHQCRPPACVSLLQGVLDLAWHKLGFKPAAYAAAFDSLSASHGQGWWQEGARRCWNEVAVFQRIAEDVDLSGETLLADLVQDAADDGSTAIRRATCSWAGSAGRSEGLGAHACLLCCAVLCCAVLCCARQPLRAAACTWPRRRRLAAAASRAAGACLHAATSTARAALLQGCMVRGDGDHHALVVLSHSALEGW